MGGGALQKWETPALWSEDPLEKLGVPTLGEVVFPKKTKTPAYVDLSLCRAASIELTFLT